MSAKRTLKDTHALGFSCTTESTVAAMTALVNLQSRTSTFGDPDLSWIRHPHHTDRAVFACSISDLHHIYDFLHKIFYKLKLLFEAKFWKSSAFDMIHICFCFFFFFWTKQLFDSLIRKLNPITDAPDTAPFSSHHRDHRRPKQPVCPNTWLRLGTFLEKRNI